MPMDRSRFWQVIFQNDANTISLVHLDRRAGARAVEAPAIDRLPGRDFSPYGFCSELEHLHTIVNCEWLVLDVRRDHWQRCRICGTIGCARSIHAEQPRGAGEARCGGNRTLYKRSP